MEIRKAVRKKAKMRLGISAPSGAGKTYSALLMAAGMGKKIGMIDTENGSGDLYADLIPGGYDIIPLASPYTPERYMEALKSFEKDNYDVVVIDSLSHAWAGAGGALEKQGKIADKSGNSYTAWRQVTPGHNMLIDALLQSPCHILVTLRAKTEYVQEKNDQGKTIVRKVGLSPVFRDGIEYEFTVFMDIDQQHEATVTKDRTRLFTAEYFKPTIETGKLMLNWLEKGIDTPTPVLPPMVKTPLDDILEHIKGIDNMVHLTNFWIKITKEGGDYHTFTGEEKTAIMRAKDERKAELKKEGK